MTTQTEQPLDAFLADAGLSFDDIPVALGIHNRALAAERRATVERIGKRLVAVDYRGPRAIGWDDIQRVLDEEAAS